MKYKCLLFLIVLISFKLTAQKNDTSYYEVHKRNLCVTLIESKRNYSINIKSNPYRFLSDTIDIKYKGNTPLTTGFCIDYDIFSIAFNFKSVNVNEGTRGLSELFNIGIGFGGTQYIVETYYSYLKGFYDVNSPYYAKSYQTDGIYYSQPELVSQTLKGKFIYVFNDKRYAFKNGYSAIYRQKKSAGSILLQGNVAYSKFSNNKSLVPEEQSSDSLIREVRTLNSLSVATGGGAGGTWVIGSHFYLSGALFLLAEMQEIQASDNSGKISGFDVNAGFDSRLCFGFNTRNFYTSIGSRAETSIFRVNNFSMQNSNLFFDLNIGYRFDFKDPNFMKRLRKNKAYQFIE